MDKHFLNSLIQRMFVISYDDFPDTVVFTYKEMSEKIKEQGVIAAYEYKMEDKWTVVKKYFNIEGPIWVFAGDWNVPMQYYSYNDPNICPSCKQGLYMQGNYCLDCNSCEQCGEVGLDCLC